MFFLNDRQEFLVMKKNYKKTPDPRKKALKQGISDAHLDKNDGCPHPVGDPRHNAYFVGLLGMKIASGKVKP